MWIFNIFRRRAEPRVEHREVYRETCRAKIAHEPGQQARIDALMHELCEINARIVYSSLMFRLKMRAIREKQGK